MFDHLETLTITSADAGVYTVALHRPEVHNAFNENMIEELTHVLETLSDDNSARVLLIVGSGKSFCAGADLNWMKRSALYSEEENFHDAHRMGQMMHRLYSFPSPTIAMVHGNVFGGGVGLVACCDIAYAEHNTVFSLSEVKLGLIPSVIGPYVCEAIGVRNARRYFLTGERFDAADAHRLGLVHETGSADETDRFKTQIIKQLLESGPQAQMAAKKMIQDIFAPTAIDERIQSLTAKKIAAIRAGEEGKEGVSAFLEKRSPNWRKRP